MIIILLCIALISGVAADLTESILVLIIVVLKAVMGLVLISCGCDREAGQKALAHAIKN